MIIITTLLTHYVNMAMTPLVLRGVFTQMNITKITILIMSVANGLNIRMIMTTLIGAIVSVVDLALAQVQVQGSGVQPAPMNVVIGLVRWCKTWTTLIAHGARVVLEWARVLTTAVAPQRSPIVTAMIIVMNIMTVVTIIMDNVILTGLVEGSVIHGILQVTHRATVNQVVLSEWIVALITGVNVWSTTSLRLTQLRSR